MSTTQGGEHASSKPSLRAVKREHNALEGAQLSGMLTRCKLRSATGITANSNGVGGDPYLVLPMPRGALLPAISNWWRPLDLHSPVTVGLCNRGR